MAYFAPKAFIWDPTEPVATRPLMLQVPDWGSTLFYAHDGNKNVSEVFYYALGNGIAAHYDYAPFGAVIRTAKATSVARDILSENPFRFSSEVHDNSLGLVYYNYRHYNPKDGRWLGREPMGESIACNIYALANNRAVPDILGLYGADIHFEAMYYLAMQCGYTPAEAYIFACGSLAPDLGRYDAVYAGMRGHVDCALYSLLCVSYPFMSIFVKPAVVADGLKDEVAQLREYQEILHNLNGFDTEQLSRYRCCLECLLRDTQDLYQKGVIAHVLGDTYAHTYLTEDGQTASIGNNAMLGHAGYSVVSSFTGGEFYADPDDISLPPNASRYQDYSGLMEKILRANKGYYLDKDTPLLWFINTKDKMPSPPALPDEAQVDTIYPQIKSCFESARRI